MDWTGEDGKGGERKGKERLFFPPSQKCDCGTSNGLDWRGVDRRGLERNGKALLSAVAEM